MNAVNLNKISLLFGENTPGGLPKVGRGRAPSQAANRKDQLI